MATRNRYVEGIIVTPRFLKNVKTEPRRESATYIREENTPHIDAKSKVT